jgi:hypothetical protein
VNHSRLPMNGEHSEVLPILPRFLCYSSPRRSTVCRGPTCTISVRHWHSSGSYRRGIRMNRCSPHLDMVHLAITPSRRDGFQAIVSHPRELCPFRLCLHIPVPTETLSNCDLTIAGKPERNRREMGGLCGRLSIELPAQM